MCVCLWGGTAPNSSAGGHHVSLLQGLAACPVCKKVCGHASLCTQNCICGLCVDSAEVQECAAPLCAYHGDLAWLQKPSLVAVARQQDSLGYHCSHGALAFALAQQGIQSGCFGTAEDPIRLLWHSRGSDQAALAQQRIQSDCFGTAGDPTSLLWHPHKSLPWRHSMPPFLAMRAHRSSALERLLTWQLQLTYACMCAARARARLAAEACPWSGPLN